MGLLTMKTQDKKETLNKLNIQKETHFLLDALSTQYGYTLTDKADVNEVVEELLKKSLKRKKKMPKENIEYVNLGRIEISEDTATKLYELASTNGYDLDSNEDISFVINKLLFDTMNGDKNLKEYIAKRNDNTSVSSDT